MALCPGPPSSLLTRCGADSWHCVPAPHREQEPCSADCCLQLDCSEIAPIKVVQLVLEVLCVKQARTYTAKHGTGAGRKCGLGQIYAHFHIAVCCAGQWA